MLICLKLVWWPPLGHLTEKELFTRLSTQPPLGHLTEKELFTWLSPQPHYWETAVHLALHSATLLRKSCSSCCPLGHLSATSRPPYWERTVYLALHSATSRPPNWERDVHLALHSATSRPPYWERAIHLALHSATSRPPYWERAVHLALHSATAWPPYWERAVHLALHSSCVLRFGIFVSFPFVVVGGIWILILSVPDHCPFKFNLKSRGDRGNFVQFLRFTFARTWFRDIRGMSNL